MLAERPASCWSDRLTRPARAIQSGRAAQVEIWALARCPYPSCRRSTPNELALQPILHFSRPVEQDSHPGHDEPPRLVTAATLNGGLRRTRPGATCHEPIQISPCRPSPDRHGCHAVRRTTGTLNASGRSKRNLRRVLRLPRVFAVARTGVRTQRAARRLRPPRRCLPQTSRAAASGSKRRAWLPPPSSNRAPPVLALPQK